MLVHRDGMAHLSWPTPQSMRRLSCHKPFDTCVDTWMCTLQTCAVVTVVTSKHGQLFWHMFQVTYTHTWALDSCDKEASMSDIYRYNESTSKQLNAWTLLGQLKTKASQLGLWNWKGMEKPAQGNQRQHTRTCVWKEVSTLIDMCMQYAWVDQDRKISKLEIHININFIIKHIHLQTQNWQMQQMSRLPKAIIAKVPTTQETFSLQIQTLKLFDSCA